MIPRIWRHLLVLSIALCVLGSGCRDETSGSDAGGSDTSGAADVADTDDVSENETGGGADTSADTADPDTGGSTSDTMADATDAGADGGDTDTSDADGGGSEPPRRVGFMFWQYETDDLDAYDRILGDLEVTLQNGYQDAFSKNVGDRTIQERLDERVSHATEYGWSYQGYFNADRIEPSDIASLDWPEAFIATMWDSEQSVDEVDLGEYADIRQELPSRIAMTAPEAYNLQSDSRTETQEFLQKWYRVDNAPDVSAAQVRRLTNGAGIVHLAQAHGVPVKIGPQMFNTSYGENGGRETKENLRAAIHLLGQQALMEDLTILSWGAGHVDDLSALEDIAEAIRELNALEIPADAEPVEAKVAAIQDESTVVLWNGMQVYWEMLTRSNIPYDVLFADDVTEERLADHEAVVTPHLTINSLDADTRAALKDFAENHGPVLTECADRGEYKNPEAPEEARPTWVTTLRSARAHRQPSEWYPSFSKFGVTETDGLSYMERMRPLVADFRSKSGVDPYTTDEDIVERRFVSGGEEYRWRVDLSNGDQTVEAVQ